MPQFCSTAGSQGDQGRDGDKASAGIAGKKAAKGQQQPQTPFSLPAKPAALWLTSVFQDIQRQYINLQGNSDAAACLARLKWLQMTVLAGRQLAQSNDPAVDRSDFDSVTLSIKSLLTNISLGLDVYGRAQNFVPLISFDTMNTSLTAHLDTLDAVQKARDALNAKEERQTHGLTLLNSAVTSLQNFTAQAQSEISSLSERINNLNSEINEELEELSNIWVELNAAEVAFKNSISQTAQCDYSSVLRCAAMVATVVATGGAAAAVVIAHVPLSVVTLGWGAGYLRG